METIKDYHCEHCGADCDDSIREIDWSMSEDDCYYYAKFCCEECINAWKSKIQGNGEVRDNYSVRKLEEALLHVIDAKKLVADSWHEDSISMCKELNEIARIYEVKIEILKKQQ